MRLKSLLKSKSIFLSYYFLRLFFLLLLITTLQYSYIKFILKEDYFKGKENRDELSEFDEDNFVYLPEPEQKLPEIPNEIILTEGDSFSSILSQSGISAETGSKIIKAILPYLNPRKLAVGTVINLEYEDDKNKSIPSKLIINLNSSKQLALTFSGDKYDAKEITVPLVRHIARLSGEVKGSFVATASKMKIPNSSITSLIKAFSYDIDFQRDLKAGDKLDVIIDRYYTKEGKFSHSGHVLYASLTIKNKKYEIYKYKNKFDDEEYYNETATSIKKALLRTPINAARISSSFGMRKHPIFGYSKKHKGVDFSAPIGTPILSAGSGIVELMGKKSGYGNYIKIRHNNIYATAYAHMSKFQAGVRVGTRVKQGQVIGYVGMTGNTTGPHLHYEIIQNGIQVNPQNVKISSVGNKLSGKELKKFKMVVAEIKKLLSKVSPNNEIVIKSSS